MQPSSFDRSPQCVPGTRPGLNPRSDATDAGNPWFLEGPKKGQVRPADQIWSSLLFELEHSTCEAELQELDERVKAGTLEREEYLRGIVRLEYQAWLRTWAFYATIYVPWCEERGISTSAADWKLAHFWSEQDYMDRAAVEHRQ